jgi:acyl dehydratase
VSDDDVIGKPTPPQTVVLERGPTSYFASAVRDNSPIHRSPEAAKAAGFDSIPAPPTYAFAWHHMGQWDELQPEDADMPNPMMQAIGELMQGGGLVLHGEQEFIYHRPIVVGEQLTSRGAIKDKYAKTSSSGKVMTFVVTETDWLGEDGQPALTSITTLLHRA